jgi:predicted dehydrogenase
MNILFLGLGSIGQRHLRNLKDLDSKIKFFAYRKKFSTPTLNTNNKILKADLKKKFSITYIKSLNEIKKLNIDCAFICTPSSFHASEVVFLIKENIHCFIEKPLMTSFFQKEKLKKVLFKKKIITMMGYQLKFNPIILYLIKLINGTQSKLGQILNVSIHHGEHIDDFHPYESYKGTYAATKKLGGGVVLSLIHEIDYFLTLFKNYKIIKQSSVASKVSDLNLDVEDIFSGIFLLKNTKNNNKILCNLNLNFFERPKKRQIKIIGTQGSLLACLNSQFIKIYIGKKTKTINFSYKKNDIFKKEVKFFLDHVKSKKKIPKYFNICNGYDTSLFALKLKKKIFV